MVKLHLELEGEVDEVVRVLRRIGGGDNEDGEVRDGPRPAPTGERTSAVDTVPERGQRQLLQRWRQAAGRRSWLPTSRRVWTSWPGGCCGTCGGRAKGASIGTHSARGRTFRWWSCARC